MLGLLALTLTPFEYIISHSKGVNQMENLAAVEQTEGLAAMPTRKRRTPKPKTRTARPRILRSRRLPKPKKRQK